MSVSAVLAGTLAHPPRAETPEVEATLPKSRPLKGLVSTQWDRRVLPLVRFVEHDRGLSFKHPVPVHFLSDQDFAKRTVTKSEQLSRADRQQLDQAAHELTALGLAQVDASTLFAEQNTLVATNTLAFYDSDRKVIFIRGTTLDLDGRITVAHELTHALQDQYFNLNRLNARAGRQGSQASDAVTSLIEGDATTVESDYVSSLSRTQQNRHFASQHRQTAAAEGALSPQIPAVLQAVSEAPYDLGPTFVEALLKDGGHQQLNRAFTQPPTSDAQILDPGRYLKGTKSLPVSTPSLAPGESSSAPPDTLGALGLYYTLVGRLNPLRALQAADAWGADRLVSYQRGGTPCVRIAIKGARPQDTATIAQALQQWVSQGPTNTSSFSQTAAGITVQACEPGLAAIPPNSRIQDASSELATRSTLLSQAIDGGLPPALALCAANRLVTDPAVPALLMLDQPSKSQIDEFDAKIQVAVTACSRR
jgi:hypothetical protein